MTKKTLNRLRISGSCHPRKIPILMMQYFLPETKNSGPLDNEKQLEQKKTEIKTENSLEVIESVITPI